jgi:hypothetical protein
VRLHERLCFVLLLLAFVTRVYVHHLRAGSLPVFECLLTHLLWVDALHSHSLLFIHRRVCRLHAGAFVYSSKCVPPSHGAFSYSSTCAPPSHGLSFHVWELDTQLFIVPRTMRVCARVVCFGTWHWRCWRCLPIEMLEHYERRLFCLPGLVRASGTPKALLALKCFCLCFHYFYLVCGFLEIHSFRNDFIYAFALFS